MKVLKKNKCIDLINVFWFYWCTNYLISDGIIGILKLINNFWADFNI